MKKLHLNKKVSILFVIVIAMISLIVLVPTALATEILVDADYNGPPSLKINWNAADYQVFYVGETINITGHGGPYAKICDEYSKEARTDSMVEVDGPSGYDFLTYEDNDFNGNVCTEVNTNVDFLMPYDLTAPGSHEIYMYSDAAVRSVFHPDWAYDLVEAVLHFIVVDFTSVGDCISTRIDTNCDGFKGPDKAECVKEQIGYCHEYFDVPSAYNE